MTEGVAMTEDMTRLEIQLNSKIIGTIAEFVNLKSRCFGNQKKGCFLRHIGCDNKEEFLLQLNRMDEILMSVEKKEQSGYLRVAGLNSALNRETAERLVLVYENWVAQGVADRNTIQFPFSFENAMWELALKETYDKVLQMFEGLSSKNTPTIVRNFAIKLLFWIESYFPKLFLQTKHLSHFPKLVFSGVIKEQEYLFLYFLSLVGCDVLYINPAGDVPFTDSRILQLSQLTKHQNIMDISIPPMGVQAFVTPPKAHTAPNPVKQKPMPAQSISAARLAAEEGEKDYISLAGLATAVVMISAFNDKEECIQTGSGVLINREGYILTNFHVVQGGAYFGIRMEEREEIYYTSELVKYHNINDLALLKIEINEEPIPIYRGARPLVRGQKVVAIGSPLGLFNSVSDGLVAGFRTVRDVPMIQFTAPISNGSSGGALLDMQGRLIGIITAGFDNGQNLNLAVDYETVLSFVRGFVEQ